MQKLDRLWLKVDDDDGEEEEDGEDGDDDHGVPPREGWYCWYFGPLPRSWVPGPSIVFHLFCGGGD
jgi:hypothetical protein